jgi:ribose 5-phosphate isomerase A
MSEELYASALLRWPESISDLESKQTLAARVAEQAEDGQLIGIGSGPEAYLVLGAIARRATDQGLEVGVVCVSFETETAALTLGLGVRELGAGAPDWAVDRADEVDSDRRVLKARGGGPSKDRLLWSTARRMFVAMDPPGSVARLGQTLALPVEVQRDAVRATARELTRLGAEDVALRLSTGKDGPVFTESGNLLLDARFPRFGAGLSADIKALPGVIDTGLFEGFAFEIL